MATKGKLPIYPWFLNGKTGVSMLGLILEGVYSKEFDEEFY